VISTSEELQIANQQANTKREPIITSTSRLTTCPATKNRAFQDGGAVRTNAEMIPFAIHMQEMPPASDEIRWLPDAQAKTSPHMRSSNRNSRPLKKPNPIKDLIGNNSPGV
jgi:hypothetical protein